MGERARATRARQLVWRQGTTKRLRAGDLGSGTGRLTVREAREGDGSGRDVDNSPELDVRARLEG